MLLPQQMPLSSRYNANFSHSKGSRNCFRPWIKYGCHVNPTLTIHGIVLTMFDPRNSLADQVVADVRAFMGERVYDTVIPRNVRVSEAPSHGKPVLLYDLKCSGSQAYLKLASEIIQREGRWRALSLLGAVGAED